MRSHFGLAQRSLQKATVYSHTLAREAITSSLTHSTVTHPVTAPTIWRYRAYKLCVDTFLLPFQCERILQKWRGLMIEIERKPKIFEQKPDDRSEVLFALFPQTQLEASLLMPAKLVWICCFFSSLESASITTYHWSVADASCTLLLPLRSVSSVIIALLFTHLSRNILHMKA